MEYWQAGFEQSKRVKIADAYISTKCLDPIDLAINGLSEACKTGTNLELVLETLKSRIIPYDKKLDKPFLDVCAHAASPVLEDVIGEFLAGYAFDSCIMRNAEGALVKAKNIGALVRFEARFRKDGGNDGEYIRERMVMDALKTGDKVVECSWYVFTHLNRVLHLTDVVKEFVFNNRFDIAKELIENKRCSKHSYSSDLLYRLHKEFPKELEYINEKFAIDLNSLIQSRLENIDYIEEIKYWTTITNPPSKQIVKVILNLSTSDVSQIVEYFLLEKQMITLVDLFEILDERRSYAKLEALVAFTKIKNLDVKPAIRLLLMKSEYNRGERNTLIQKALKEFFSSRDDIDDLQRIVDMESTGSVVKELINKRIKELEKSLHL